MRKKGKKNGKHDFNLADIALATTILNLIGEGNLPSRGNHTFSKSHCQHIMNAIARMGGG